MFRAFPNGTFVEWNVCEENPQKKVKTPWKFYREKLYTVENKRFIVPSFLQENLYRKNKHILCILVRIFYTRVYPDIK